MPCDGAVIPLGRTVIRTVDDKDCVRAERVFILAFEGNQIGTKQFKTVDDFFRYKGSECACCQDDEPDCCPDALRFNGCLVLYKGKKVKVKIDE